MDIVQLIKEKLSIEDVVSEYVELKKSGINFKGLCPFHNEKTPSFVVTPDKGLAYCFGCHTGGDMFEFIQHIEHIDFPESVRILAEKANVSDQLDPNSFQKQSAKTPLYALHRELTDMYCKNLQNKKYAEHKKYLLERGVGDDLIRKFRIGYSEESFDAAIKIAEEAGLNQDQIHSSGAFVFNTEKKKTYDRFRHRIMFPLTNGQGTIVGFSARTLEKDNPAKYINSADSPLFSKKSNLYGIHFAKDKMRALDYVLIVEGQFDVILCHSIGLHHTVASSGTAFTQNHLEVISRYTKNIVFAFDADTAGVRAAKKAIEMSILAGYSIKVVLMPAKKDPADVIHKQGADAFISLLAHALVPEQFYLKIFLQHYKLKTVEEKQKCLQELSSLYFCYQSPVAKQRMLGLLELELRIEKSSLITELKKYKTKKYPVASSASKLPKTTPIKLIEYVYTYMMMYPITFSQDEKLQGMFVFLPKIWESVYNQIKTHYTDSGGFSDFPLQTPLSYDTSRLLKFRVLLSDHYSESYSDEHIQQEFLLLVRRLWKAVRQKRLKELTLDIKVAENNGDISEITQFFERQQELLAYIV